MIDNYDSFTYNLVQYLGELGEDLQVFRNDKISIKEIEKLKRELERVNLELQNSIEDNQKNLSFIEAVYNSVPGLLYLFDEEGRLVRWNKKIETIIVNGDLKHEFGAISEQEWRNVLKLLDYLGQHCGEIILIKGNPSSQLYSCRGSR